MQTAKRADAADRNGDVDGHTGHDPSVEQDPATAHLADFDEPLRALFAHSAPPEPQVTNVTPASTAGVLIGDHEGSLARMLVEPAARLFVKRHDEVVGHVGEYALRLPGRFICHSCVVKLAGRRQVPGLVATAL